MRVLAVTNMFPSPEAPANGVFVAEQIEGLKSIGLRVRVVYINRRKDGPLTYYRMAPLVRGALAEFGPDLVHVMYGGVMADLITGWRNMPPVVVTFHGSDLLGENLSGFARKLISRHGMWCSRRAAKNARGVVLVARHLKKALPGIVNWNKFRIIPCGIDLERFKPHDAGECRKRLGWAEHGFHVLFASASHDPVKRPWLAKAAIDDLSAQGVEAEMHLLTGVPYSEVPCWINASSVLLLTSLHEGSPTIVKEALACGVPVVSVDVGDVAERIESIEGCHIASSDPHEIAAKLKIVYATRKRLDCRDQIEELSRISVARQLNEFYDEILSTLKR